LEAFFGGAVLLSTCAYTGRVTTDVATRVNPNAPARSFLLIVFMSRILFRFS
jgi:hypothetical protein